MAYIQLDFKSKALTRNVNLNIFLPEGEGFPAPQPPYKTLYFLPGFSTSGRELATSLNFRIQCLLNGIAVVIPDGDNSMYLDQPERLALYGKYIEEEVVDFTRKILPLSHKREDTFIGGLSMGGYGALVHGFKDNERFGKIATLSPAVDIHRVALEHKEYSSLFTVFFESKEEYYSSNNHPMNNLKDLVKEDRTIPSLFLAVGRQDPLVLEQDQDFVEELKKMNVPVKFVEDDGNHDVLFWNKVLPAMFEFLNDGKKSNLLG